MPGKVTSTSTLLAILSAGALFTLPVFGGGLPPELPKYGTIKDFNPAAYTTCFNGLSDTPQVSSHSWASESHPLIFFQVKNYPNEKFLIVDDRGIYLFVAPPSLLRDSGFQFAITLPKRHSWRVAELFLQGEPDGPPGYRQHILYELHKADPDYHYDSDLTLNEAATTTSRLRYRQALDHLTSRVGKKAYDIRLDLNKYSGLIEGPCMAVSEAPEYQHYLIHLLNWARAWWAQ